MNILDLFITTIEEMKSVVKIIEDGQPKPFFSIEAKLLDYKEEEKTEELAFFLQSVRLTEFLSSIMHLLKMGKLQEASMLYRAILEIIEDINFIGQAHTAEEKFLKSYQDLKGKVLKYFYADIYEKEYVRRETIQKNLKNIDKEFDREDIPSLYSTAFYSYFSKFVHSNYQVIVNSFYPLRQENYQIGRETLLLRHFAIFSDLLNLSLNVLQSICCLLEKYDLEQKVLSISKKLAENELKADYSVKVFVR